MEVTVEQLNEKIESLKGQAGELLAKAEADPSAAAEVKAMVEEQIAPQLAELVKERGERLQTEEMKALRDRLTTLDAEIEELRKPSDGFRIAPDKTEETDEGKGLSDSPYADGKYSVYVDVRLANKGHQDARDRLMWAADAYAEQRGYKRTAEGKAMSEGEVGVGGSAGGYLVQPELERQLLLAREKDNVLRPLCSALNVNTSAIQLDQLSIATSAAWVAEAAEKYEATSMTLGTIKANVYTAAGLATISNQLLADSNPAVDQLVTTDLAKRIVALEETAFMVGTGNGQPTGILNTAGVNTKVLTNSEDPAVAGGLLDTILDSIAQVQLEWGQPSAIVMHPRTWTRIIKSRDAVGHYTIAPRNIFGAGYDPETPRTFVNGPDTTLYGVNVVLSNRVPTNLGTGSNESRVIVGDFAEALILDRQGITIDESPHVYFTTNQTVFRAEARVGFTAARSAKAFTVIGGSGLANG